MNTKKYLSYILLLIFVCYAPHISAADRSGAEARAYDGRNFGIITPVKDQGDTNLCWAYAAINASEAFLLKSGILDGENAKNSILSPTQVGYACHSRGKDPLENTNGASTGKDYRYSEGNTAYAAALLSQWCGPVKSGTADSANGWENAEFLLTEAVYINGDGLKEDEAERKKLKEAIVKYGAVTFSYNNARECFYYNPLGESGANSSPHACTVIGWDDDISADDFLPNGASQNGGWLIKNSYASLPYFYLSYDNTSSNIYAFSYVKKGTYDYNYFYDSDVADFGLGALMRPRSVANIFETKKANEKQGEFISAVNFGIDGKNASVSVKVYKNVNNIADPTSGKLCAEETFTADYAGFYTVRLKKPVEVNKGELFSVVAEITNGDNAYFKLTQNTGKSFVKRGSTWNELGGTPRLKAYTELKDEKIVFLEDKIKLSMPKNESGIFIVSYYDGTQLKDLRIFTVPEGTTETVNVPSDWQKGKNRRIKTMHWNSFDEMKPIGEKNINWE